ncbi:MAG: Uncharacterised protein [Glaciecola sp. HTCC2999]|nr:MAG: Uncharacterised protein [Glaciecola sp. HTCC2999]
MVFILANITKKQIEDWKKGTKKFLYSPSVSGLRVKRNKNSFVWVFVYGDKRKPKNTSGNYPETSYTIGNIEFISTRDAEIKAFLIKSEIDNGIYPDSLKYPKNNQITLGNYFTDYYLDYCHKYHTAGSQANNIRVYFKSLWNKPLAHFDANTIQNWFNTVKTADGKKPAPTTLKQRYGALIKLFSVASGITEFYKVLDENPLASISLPQYTIEQLQAIRQSREESKKLRRALSLDEVTKLRNAVKEYGNEKKTVENELVPRWFNLYFEFAYLHGFRPSDIVSFKWSHINGSMIRFTPVKTQNTSQIEIIENLSPKLIPMLTEWRSKNSSEWVFPNKFDITRHMGDKPHDKAWKAIKQMSGLNLQFYTLRHNYVSQKIIQGTPLYAIARAIGHTSTKQIEQHYGHLIIDRNKSGGLE